MHQTVFKELFTDRNNIVVESLQEYKPTKPRPVLKITKAK
jgi:hypothetical protein